jgi:SEC-C motif-containing protein
VRPNDPCPCQSGDKYKRCCGPLHRGAPAPSPERLMRSRFAAYALGLVEYVLDTTHPAGAIWRPDRAAWAADVAAFCQETDFVGLRVLDVGERGEDATVTFEAQLRQRGRMAPFVERSAFRRLDGRWLYLEAV